MGTRRRGREKRLELMAEPTVRDADTWRSLEPLLDQELARLILLPICHFDTRTPAARHSAFHRISKIPKTLRRRALPPNFWHVACIFIF